MNRQSDKMDVESLLMKVKENPAIYDVYQRNHSNRNYISSVWRKIGEELNIPGDQVKEKWHQLRSNYMRAKRVERCKTGSGTKPRTTWPYYKMMSFLDPILELKETSGNINCKTSHEIHSFSNNQHEIESMLEDSTSAVMLHTEESIVKSETSKRKRHPTDDSDQEFLAEPKKINSTSEENDADRMFLLSLLPSMKQLSPMDNIDFKLYVIQFLKEKLF
ncbi:uncharacterized protein TNCV_4407191 [Trichonephila clavipes]|nr:uncharacterized protein TNCV_4407191 [Trichonephila clavipes]